MTRVCTVLGLAVVAWGATAQPAAAQERKGFWGSFGLGLGSVGISVSSETGRISGDRQRQGIGDMSVGWALSPRLLTGVEVKVFGLTGRFTDGAGTTTSTFDVFVTNVSGVALLYPSSSNFYVKGGVGGSFIEASAPVNGATLSETHGGFGLTAEAGYDLYLGRGFSITPALGYWYGRPGMLRLGGSPALTGWRHNVLDATVSMKFN
jgi:hypothetical protein